MDKIIEYRDFCNRETADKREGCKKNVIIKKYKRGITITDSVETTLISVGVIMAGVGFAVPIMLPLEITATVCGTLGMSMKHMIRKLMSEAQKHFDIKTLPTNKLNFIKNICQSLKQWEDIRTII